MVQIPTDVNAIQWTSVPSGRYLDIQNEVVKEVLGIGGGRTALSGAFQTTIDHLSDDTFFDYTNLLKWWVYTDDAFDEPDGPAPVNDPGVAVDSIPAVFNEFFRLGLATRCYRAWRSAEKADAYWKAHAAPLMERLATYFDATFGTQTPGRAADDMTLNTLRRYVIAILIRQRTPVIPPFNQSHQIIRAEFVKLWNSKRWTFRVRHKRLLIDAATNGITLPAGDNDIIDGIASKHMTLRMSDGTRRRVIWLDSERFAEAAAFFGGSDPNATNPAPRTGTPRYFFDEDTGTPPPIIHLLPIADRDYDVFVNVVVGAPSFTTGTVDANNALGQLPPEFRHWLADKIVAVMLSKWGREDVDAARALRESKREFDELSVAWADRGAHRYTARGHHQVKFIRDRASFWGSNILGQLE